MIGERGLASLALAQWRMSDGCETRGRISAPEPTAPRRAFLILHGIQSHGGWYEQSALRLAESGRLVVMPDRRGSGMNAAARGDTPGATRWLADLDELSDWCRTAHGVETLDLVGISWGGKLAIAWALRHPARVGRILLIAPGVFPAVGVGLAAQLRIVWAACRAPTRRFAIPLDDPRLFTENPERQHFIAQDPLALADATARFLFCSARLDQRLLRVGRGLLRAPTTLFLAERERIIRNAPTQAWLERICAAPPEVTVFPGASHTLEFERDPADYANRLRLWRESCS